MADNTNTDTTNPINTNTDNVEKTFTQDDVNRIVSERLARERDKRTAELDEREKALRQRELLIVAREKLDEAGLNKELCKVLRYDDEAELDEAIKQLKSIKGFDGKKPEESGKRRYIENTLPPVNGFNIDPIGNAFRLPKE